MKSQRREASSAADKAHAANGSGVMHAVALGDSLEALSAATGAVLRTHRALSELWIDIGSEIASHTRTAWSLSLNRLGPPSQNDDGTTGAAQEILASYLRMNNRIVARGQ